MQSVNLHNVFMLSVNLLNALQKNISILSCGMPLVLSVILEIVCIKCLFGEGL